MSDSSLPADLPTLPTTWVWKTLSDVADRTITYGIVQPGPEVDEGVPMVRVSDLQHGGVNQADLKVIHSDVAVKHERTTLRGGEVLLSLVGTLGVTAEVGPQLAGANVARALAVIPVASDDERSWLLHALQAPVVQRYVNRWATRTVQPTLNLEDARRLPIPMPPPEVRAQATSFLGHLQALAQHRVEQARRLDGILGARFMQLHESRGAPMKPLSAISEVILGQSPPGESYNEDQQGLPFYQGSKDFGWRYPTPRVWCTDPKRTARTNDVLVSVRAPVGDLNIATEDCVIGRGVTALRSQDHPNLLYVALNSADAAWAPYRGGGTVFSSINKRDLTALPVPWLPDEEAAAFEAVTARAGRFIRNQIRQATLLRQMYAAALPEVVGGSRALPARMRVPEAAA